MSRLVEDILRQERNMIQTNIDRIEPHSLPGHGNHDMLALQRGHLKIVDTLMPLAHDPMLIVHICRQWLREAGQMHAHVAEEHFSNAKRNDIWWQTLDEIQYISRLLSLIREQVTL